MLETTAEHPFYELEAVPGLAVGQYHTRWTDAGKLEVGDLVWQADGTTGVVRAVEVVPVQQPMYNLTVDVAHMFFVGDGAWLVHNCKQGHHPWPKYLGGADKQPLYYATTEQHQLYHNALDEFLPRRLGKDFYDQLLANKNTDEFLDALLEFNKYFDETHGTHFHDTLLDSLKEAGKLP